MKTEARRNALWLMIRTKEPGRSGESHFVRVGDDRILEALRIQCADQDLYVSMCLYRDGHADAVRIYRLYFRVRGKSLEEMRVSALETAYYLVEHFGVPDDQIEFLYDGKASISLSVPPMVFEGHPTPLMPALNYYLARQMVDDGIKNIDIDVYQRDSLLPLPNSTNSATGRFAIPLPLKELLYVDIHRIAELSQQPRPDDSMIMPRQVPEAVEWFAEVHAEYEKKQRQQDELRRLVLKDGWEVPPCIRRLLWLDADESTILEAFRLISGTYSFLGSSEAEIRYHILRLSRRNAIEAFKKHQRLRAIITFGVENPMLADCQHFLLHRYCHGACFVADLIEEYEKPYLFEKM